MGDSTAIGVRERRRIRELMGEIRNHIKEILNLIQEIHEIRQRPILVAFKEDFDKGLVVVSNIEKLGQIISEISRSTDLLIDNTNEYLLEHAKNDQ